MNDPSHPHDWEFHDEAVSDLYRATRDSEPPAWLDQQILAAAQTAVTPSSAPALARSRRRSARFWAMPVALAATIIMAVGMVRLTWEAGEWDARMDRPMQTSSLAESAAEADAARPERREREAAKPQPAATLSLPASASPTITAPARMMRMAPPSVRGEEERMSDEQRLRNILQTKPATRDEDTKRPQQQTDRSPEEWLAHIARLRQQGRIAEAQASFEEFRRRYPHYPLPIEEGTD